MPKLLLFAPCEQALIDQNSNLSLISLLQEIRLALPETIPEKAQGAIKWLIVTLWERLERDDPNTSYKQRWELVAPDGHATGLSGEVVFQIKAHTHRTLHTNFGFPISQMGRYTLKLSLEGYPEYDTSFPIFLTRISKGES